MSTQAMNDNRVALRSAAAVDLKLEVVVIPVADADRSRHFYEGIGWRLVQMTPPGSPCSVMFGKGFTSAEPGTLQGTFLVVDDLDATRAGNTTGPSSTPRTSWRAYEG